MTQVTLLKKLAIVVVSAGASIFAFGVSPSTAASFTSTIGDNDGFGFGATVVPDGADLPNINLPQDRRSASEAAATNGAQQTDFYSAIFSPLPSSFDVIFDLPGELTSGTLEIDMGGFQATFGQINVAFNGVLQTNLLNFEDGAFATRVRQFILSPTAIANANTAGKFIVNFDRSSSRDAIAFDYFNLSGTVNSPTAVPTPALLPGLIGLGIGVLRKRKAQAAKQTSEV